MKLEIIRKLKNSQYVEIKQHCPEQPIGQRRKQVNQKIPGQTASWVTNEASVNLRKLKSYQISFPTTTL